MAIHEIVLDYERKLEAAESALAAERARTAVLEAALRGIADHDCIYITGPGRILAEVMKKTAKDALTASPSPALALIEAALKWGAAQHRHLGDITRQEYDEIEDHLRKTCDAYKARGA